MPPKPKFVLPYPLTHHERRTQRILSLLNNKPKEMLWSSFLTRTYCTAAQEETERYLCAVRDNLFVDELRLPHKKPNPFFLARGWWLMADQPPEQTRVLEDHFARMRRRFVGRAAVTEWAKSTPEAQQAQEKNQAQRRLYRDMRRKHGRINNKLEVVRKPKRMPRKYVD
eukprot:TRINITY_DN1505_c0_g1_i1.p2 TRINITY_DN1505_c0_g1~~TRINITY_DN1505_c0_g1_i1.p2  ORF type:complete len:169 (+),score=38.00 TRINITY_DN1505_c0_g1_i1:44-550(+)